MEVLDTALLPAKELRVLWEGNYTLEEEFMHDVIPQGSRANVNS